MEQSYKIITVVLANEREDGFPPSGLMSFLDWAKAVVDAVPIEFMPTATISITSETDWDWHTARVEVNYRRPETSEEWEHRKLTAMHRNLELELKERASLVALKAKYEPF